MKLIAFRLLSKLVEAAGINVHGHAAAVDLHLVSRAAEAGLGGTVAVGIYGLAVDVGMEFRGSRTGRTKRAALEGEFALTGSGESHLHLP